MPINPALAHLDQKLLGRIPLVVGVTGHRDLRPQDRDLLETTVSNVLADLKRDYLDNSPHTPIVILSGLAEGADQLVAKIAVRDHGAILVAAFPMEAAEYREDFRGNNAIAADAETEFDKLWKLADATYEVPYREGSSRNAIQTNPQQRDEQYQDLGHFIVRHSNLVIALWNGDERELKTGGTGQVMEYKRSGIPIGPSHSARDALDGSEMGPVIEVATPRVKSDLPPPAIEVKPWGIAITGRAGTLARGIADAMTFAGKVAGHAPHPDPDRERRMWRVFEATTAQTCRFNTEAANFTNAADISPEKSYGYLFLDSDDKPLAGAQERAQETALHWGTLYGLADALAQTWQERFKKDWWLLFGCGFLALLIFEVYAHLLPPGAGFWANVLLLAYFAIFLFAFGYFIRARYLERQERFLDYRALAEGLRVAVYWKLAGMTTPLAAAYPIKQPSELAWVRIVLRTLDMIHEVAAPASAPATPASLTEVRMLWVDGQRAYFKRRGDEHHQLAEIWEARSLTLLALSPLLGLVLIFWHPPALLHHFMIVVIAGLVGGAALIAGLMEKLAHHAHASQYDRMQLLFERALALVSEIDLGQRLDEYRNAVRRAWCGSDEGKCRLGRNLSPAPDPAGRLTMADVRLDGITKRWGTVAAVEDVTFSARSGELVALLGPSGCGKSTTLRLIAGLDTADEGTIKIADRDVTALPPAKRGVSMVFQNYALFPHLSVAENILFGLRVRDVPRAERDARLKRASGILGLDALLERKPSQLSGGQQQRVALGRAIVAETKVCLMDEPLSNLDAQLRVEMRREIRALQRRLGMTMLYVTHDQVEAMTMADQVVLMRGGRIEQDAAPALLYEKPATIFAARFVGTPPMNVIAAALVPDNLAAPPGGRARDTVAIGIRPEDTRLAADGMRASVAAVEYLGADTLIETKLGDQSFIVRQPGRTNATVGEPVNIRWEPSAAHWFDLSSQCRIDP